jgi:uncharacterized membrane protein
MADERRDDRATHLGDTVELRHGDLELGLGLDLELHADFELDGGESHLAQRSPSTPGPGEVLTITLPVRCAVAYEAFCRAEAIPSWLSIVRSVRVLSRTPSGRPARAAFIGRLPSRVVGYTLFYRYSETDRIVWWGTAPGSAMILAGRAQFLPLGERATLMQYQLVLELPEGALAPGDDPFAGGHATSAVMNDFRDYVIRTRRA